MDLMPPDRGGGIPPLLTPRLRLRGLTADDASGIFRIFSESEVMRYWSTRYHLNGEIQDSVIYGLLATEMEMGL